MGLFCTKPAVPTESWGELRPRRDCAWKEEEQRVSLLVPRFGRGTIGRRLDRWLKSRPYRVHLDEVGSFVWQQCDGEATVEQIATAMRDHFGDRIEPAGERLVLFLQMLGRGRFVTLDSRQSAPS